MRVNFFALCQLFIIISFYAFLCARLLIEIAYVWAFIVQQKEQTSALRCSLFSQFSMKRTGAHGNPVIIKS